METTKTRKAIEPIYREVQTFRPFNNAYSNVGLPGYLSQWNHNPYQNWNTPNTFNTHPVNFHNGVTVAQNVEPLYFDTQYVKNEFGQNVNVASTQAVMNHTVTNWTPSVNIYEAETFFELDMLIPGYTKEDVKIKIFNNILTVTGVKSYTDSEEDVVFEILSEEFYNAQFERSFLLGESVNVDEVVAHFEHGVLTLSLAKTVADQEEVREVEIIDASEILHATTAKDTNGEAVLA